LLVQAIDWQKTVKAVSSTSQFAPPQKNQIRQDFPNAGGLSKELHGLSSQKVPVTAIGSPSLHSTSKPFVIGQSPVKYKVIVDHDRIRTERSTPMFQNTSGRAKSVPFHRRRANGASLKLDNGIGLRGVSTYTFPTEKTETLLKEVPNFDDPARDSLNGGYVKRKLVLSKKYNSSLKGAGVDL
jgi:hypothetical protein